MRLYTQLNFGGNCEEAFRFYKENLGGNYDDDESESGARRV